MGETENKKKQEGRRKNQVRRKIKIKNESFQLKKTIERMENGTEQKEQN
jgi:hypothetical protein